MVETGRKEQTRRHTNKVQTICIIAFPMITKFLLLLPSKRSEQPME